MADGPLSAEGVDYAWSRPDIAALAAAGKKFACRYGGPGSDGKQLDPVEAQRLSAAGVAIVANAEGAADGLRNGFAAGASWARDAEAHFRACGMPAGRPIYFSVDFDATSGDWGQLDAAMDGAASVIGRSRVGVYGEYSIIEHFAANRKAVWYWQTYAWSNGRWSAHNHIEQYRNGVQLAGATLDLDRAYGTDYGQWTIGEVDVDASDVTAVWQYFLAPEGYNMQDHLLNAEKQAAQANAKLDELTAPELSDEQLAKIAAMVAAQLKPLIPTVEAIATAVADEDHRRSAS